MTPSLCSCSQCSSQKELSPELPTASSPHIAHLASWVVVSLSAVGLESKGGASSGWYPAARHWSQIVPLWYLPNFCAFPLASSRSLHRSPIARYRVSITLPIECGAGLHSSCGGPHRASFL